MASSPNSSPETSLSLLPGSDAAVGYFSLGLYEQNARKHRALTTLQLSEREAFVALLWTLILSAALVFLLPWIGIFWKLSFDFGVTLLRLPYDTEYQVYNFQHWINFNVPFLVVPTPKLSPSLNLLVGEISMALLIVSFVVPKNWVPLRYSLRVIVGMLVSSLLFFCFLPHAFPYTLTDYLLSIIKINLVFLVVIPWTLGFTYFILDFKFYQKVWLSWLIIGYFIIEIPIHYLAQLLLLRYFSMLLAPFLFVTFGLSFQVFAFMALYAWGMSWES